jgi:Leucine-rich repeat (LRR) protein
VFFFAIGIDKLQSLTNLDLSNNSLEEIPLEILSLNSTLIELDLSNNNLTSLPDRLVNMIHLKTLRLTGNQFSLEELKKIKSAKFTHDNSVVEIGETVTPAGLEKTVLSTAHLSVLSDSSSPVSATNGSTPTP